jgi:hypothetical protein
VRTKGSEGARRGEESKATGGGARRGGLGRAVVLGLMSAVIINVPIDGHQQPQSMDMLRTDGTRESHTVMQEYVIHIFTVSIDSIEEADEIPPLGARRRVY